RPGTYDLRFPNATSLLVPRVWERLADDALASVVLNVPGTYPARAPAGSLLVSGFVSPRLTRSVSPPGWFPRVEELGYRTDDDALCVGSDHGFAPVRAEVHRNHWLAEEGFLRFGGVQPGSLADIGSGTVAFALDPGRIYLHRKGRYPLGEVSPRDEPGILADLTAGLEALRDPDRGKPALGPILLRGNT